MQLFIVMEKTSIQQIGDWAVSVGISEQDAAISMKDMLSVGVLYYKRKGIIVANPKKGGIPQAQEEQQQQQPPGRQTPFGGNSYKPPGIGRMRI